MREPKPAVVIRFDDNQDYAYLIEERHTVEDFKKRLGEFLGMFIDDPDYDRDMQGDLRRSKKKMIIEFNDERDLNFLRSLIDKN